MLVALLVALLVAFLGGGSMSFFLPILHLVAFSLPCLIGLEHEPRIRCALPSHEVRRRRSESPKCQPRRALWSAPQVPRSILQRFL